MNDHDVACAKEQHRMNGKEYIKRSTMKPEKDKSRIRTVAAVAFMVALVSVTVNGVADPIDDIVELADEACEQNPMLASACNGTGLRMWQTSYNGPGVQTDTDIPWAIASQEGIVYVTGQSEGSDTKADYATIAYNPVTGVAIWEARWDGGSGDTDIANAIAVGDGKVVVTGKSRTATAWDDYATVAYDAVSGEQLWEVTYNGPAHFGDIANAVAVGGDNVFVTGQSVGNEGYAYGTIAYDIDTGDESWIARYDGPANAHDTASDLVVSGDTVVVTGKSAGVGTNNDYLTVAYDGETGDELWTARYDGGFEESDNAHAIVLSPDGDSVYVTGSSAVDFSCQDGFCGNFYDYATIAYDVETGEESWVARYDGSDGFTDWAYAVAVAEDLVFVTGFSVGNTGVGDNDFATVAYDAATGDEAWEARFDGPSGDRSDVAYDVAVGLGKVYVTGSSASEGVAGTDDYLTVAYDLTTGDEIWRDRYDGAAIGQDTPRGIVADGNRIFVTGMSKGAATKFDYVTIGYVDLGLGLPLPG